MDKLSKFLYDIWSKEKRAAALKELRSNKEYKTKQLGEVAKERRELLEHSVLENRTLQLTREANKLVEGLSLPEEAQRQAIRDATTVKERDLYLGTFVGSNKTVYDIWKIVEAASSNDDGASQEDMETALELLKSFPLDYAAFRRHARRRPLENLRGDE